ncbi:Zinc finger and BTB domain-containing protein 24 [Portunus trituberculatus]|uniref:Zinc finger and BTB domain-containing protein 24 n=1 Tax=Portunus trituberculatus TaxID=210409 RepID=A0A5B7H2D7_PORTR|nr:Zinc finger and BTB domain-containing protein 24 [Portunus trituberculatus]
MVKLVTDSGDDQSNISIPIEGEEEEEENEQVSSRREDVHEVKNEQEERKDKDDQEDSEEIPSKGVTMAAVREGGQGEEGDVPQWCQWCGVISASPHEAALHTAAHTCPQCGLVVTRPSALPRHLQVVHGVGQSGAKHCHTCTHSGRVYKCGQCDRIFSHPRNLASHQVRHKDRRVCCPRCPAKFFLREELHKHLNQVHRRCRPYTCHVCSRSFCQRSVLQHHRTIHATHSHARLEIHPPTSPPALQSDRLVVNSNLDTIHSSTVHQVHPSSSLPTHSSSLNSTYPTSSLHLTHPSSLHHLQLSGLYSTPSNSLQPSITLNSIKVQKIKVEKASQGVPQPSPSSHVPYPPFDLFEEVLGLERDTSEAGDLGDDRQILLVKGDCEEGVESATLILERGSDVALRLEGESDGTLKLESGSDTTLRLEGDLMLS